MVSGQQKISTGVAKTEDAALKLMMQFFAEELLPLFGIEGKAEAIVPTELVDIRIANFFEDFNLKMEDGSWKHFEFQSTNEGKKGLKRFRSYEAVAGYQHNVSITTYVLFSGKIKNPMTEFTEGVNTYRVVPIIMQEKDADEFIGNLQKKMENGEEITRSDLVWLTLSPLMGGEMPQKERIKAALQITKEKTEMTIDEQQKIGAVIYAMANKFLESMDMEEIKEGIKMTKLGEMLVADGRAEGRAQIVSMIRRKVEKGMNVSEISDMLELEENYVAGVVKIVTETPEMTDLEIAKIITK